MPHWKRNLALLWVSQLFVMVGFASTMPFIPLFVSDHLGISDPGPRGAVVASFSFAATLGYGIFNPLWGALSDRRGSSSRSASSPPRWRGRPPPRRS